MKKSLLAIVTAIALIGGVLGYSVHTSQTPQALYDAGRKYYEAKQYREAIVSLLSSLQKAPGHRDSRLLLALTYETVHDFARAVPLLKALLEVDPNDVEANLQLSSVYVTSAGPNLELLRQAQALAQKVLSQDPDSVRAMILLGNASLGLQDFTASSEVLHKAVSLDGRSMPALVALGTAEMARHNYPEAEKSFLKARDVNPADKIVLISLANYYRANGDADKAEAVLKNAFELYPADPAVYSQLADFYARAHRLPEVEQLLVGVQQHASDDLGPTLALAKIYQATNRNADARKLLVSATTRFPTNVELAAHLAGNLLQDKPAEAAHEIDKIISTAPQNPMGYILLSELRFRDGQLNEAEAALSKDVVLNSRLPQPHFLLGNIAARRGDIDQAQINYRKSLTLDATFVPARVALAEMLVAKGKPAAAREEIQNALKAQPGDVPARLVKAELDMADKQFRTAESELAALVKEQPNNAAIQRETGIYSELRGDYSTAEKSMVRALELTPDSEQSSRDLMSFYVRTKQEDRAIQKLLSVPEAQRHAFHYELLGAVEQQSGHLREAEAAYEKAIEKDSNRSSSEMFLFNLYVQTGRLDQGLQRLEVLSKKNPKSSAVYALKGTVFEMQGRIQEAESNYLQALRSDPDNDVAANNLAYLLADNGHDLQTALTWAQEARRKKPNDPNVADTLGWVYYKLGRSVSAKVQAEFAASKEPDNGLFQYHLGLIYKAHDEPTKAETALKKAIAARQEFKERSFAETALNELHY